MEYNIKEGRIDAEVSTWINYFVFADKFGWTPQEVDNLKTTEYEYLLTIISECNKESKEGKDV